MSVLRVLIVYIYETHVTVWLNWPNQQSTSQI